MKQTIVISDAPRCYLELIHNDSAPKQWIVQRSRKFLWFKRTFSVHRFNEKQRAITFATQMMKNHHALFGGGSSHKRPRPAQGL